MKHRLDTIKNWFLLFLLQLSIVSAEDRDADLRNIVFETGLKPPADLIHVDETFVHIAMILTNIAGKPKKEKDILIEFHKTEGISSMLIKFKKMMKSIFLHSSGTPVHCIFITDEESIHVIEEVMKREIGKYLSESIIQNPQIRYKNAVVDKFPRLRVEFVDMKSITSKHKTQIEMMKTYFGHQLPAGTVFKHINGSGPDMVPVRKYQLDLFYMMPFYHLEFPTELEKLIVLDIDLEFRQGNININWSRRLACSACGGGRKRS